jgi:hypothetical protein
VVKKSVAHSFNKRFRTARVENGEAVFENNGEHRNSDNGKRNYPQPIPKGCCTAELIDKIKHRRGHIGLLGAYYRVDRESDNLWGYQLAYGYKQSAERGEHEPALAVFQKVEYHPKLGVRLSFFHIYLSTSNFGLSPFGLIAAYKRYGMKRKIRKEGKQYGAAALCRRIIRYPEQHAHIVTGYVQQFIFHRLPQSRKVGFA